MSKGLLTTSVGSFAKPPYLQKARNDHSAGRVSDEELAGLERQATREIIALETELAREDFLLKFALIFDKFRAVGTRVQAGYATPTGIRVWLFGWY